MKIASVRELVFFAKSVSMAIIFLSVSFFVQAAQAAPSLSLSVSPTTGIAGETSFQPVVSMSGSSASYSCRLFDGVNGQEYSTFLLSPSASIPQLSSWRFTSPGSRNFMSSCTDSAGNTIQSAGVEITIAANPNAVPPSVIAWSDKTQLASPGETVTLQWKSENALSCYLSPEFAALPLSGARVVMPTQTTYYSVSCSGAGDMSATSDIITITVDGACANGAKDYPTCTPPAPMAPFCGNYQIDPGEECDSVLAGPGALGTCPQVCSRTCTLNDCPVANLGTLNFQARGGGTSVTVRAGEAITLEWESSGKNSCVIAASGGYQNNGDSQWQGSIGGSELIKGSKTFVPSGGVGRYTYHMCQLSQFDWMGSVTVTVTDPPVIDMWASPIEIDSGKSTSLGWRVTRIQGSGSTIECNVTQPDSGIVLWSTSLPKGRIPDSTGKVSMRIDDTEIFKEIPVSPSVTTRYMVRCTRDYVDDLGNRLLSLPREEVTKSVVVKVKGTTDAVSGKVEMCATSNWFVPDGSRHPVTIKWKTKNIVSCERSASSNSIDEAMFAQYTKDLNFSGALVGPNLAQGSYNTVLGGTGNFSLKCIDLEGNTVTAGAFIYIDTRIPTQSDVDKSTPPACSDDFVSPAPGNGPGSGPTSSTTCTTPGSTCQSGTFCANGATKVGSCNSGLGSCCMTGGTRADAGGPSGSAGNASSSNSAYFNPLKFDSVEGVLTGVITQLRNIIVILSIIFIIIGAVMYILSAGNESRMNTAKGAITAALIGLTLAIAAPAFLKEIASILGWTNITDASNTIQGAQTFSQIASKVLDFLLSIVGIIGIIMLVFGGFTYLASAGDENKAETGKKIVTYAIIAIALALSALVLVTQVAKLFG